MNNQLARSDAGRFASSLFALCLAFAGLIPAAHARDNDETTKAVEHAAGDVDEPVKEETKTPNAEGLGEARASVMSPQQADPVADPEGKNIKASPVEKPGHKGGAAAPGASLADKATDPSAIFAQLANFFWTEDTADDRGIANTYLFQPVLPLTASNVLRPAIPVVTTGGMDGVTGLGDLFLLDIHLGHTSSGSWGAGVAASLPTATSDSIGSGKWSAGPAALYMYKGVPKNIFGILAYNQWSYAGDGDRAKVNVLSFQPIWVGHLKWGYLGWTDQTATVNWETNATSIPLGLRIGKVWMAKTPLNLAVEPYYTLNSDRENTWGVKFGATLIMPTWLTH